MGIDNLDQLRRFSAIAVLLLTASCSTLQSIEVGQLSPISPVVAQPVDIGAAAGRPDADNFALCLSGGGYRATLFHLGVVWRLNELGLLTHADTIAGVSGGAIFAGLLGNRWSRLEFDGNHVTPDSFDAQIVQPILALTRNTIDTTAIIASLNPTAPNPLAELYDSYLFGQQQLVDLPARGQGPQIVILATELSLGYPWYFQRDLIGSPGVGYLLNPSLPIAVAVSASTAVPGVFEPVYLQLDKSNLRFRDPEVEVREAMSQLFWQLSQEGKAQRTERGEDTFDIDAVWNEIRPLRLAARDEITVPIQLVDGGVLDNLASESCKMAERSIVSDASLYNVIDASDHGISRIAIAERAIDVMQRLNTSNLTKSLVRRNLVRSRQSVCTMSDADSASNTDTKIPDCIEPFFSYISLARETPASIEGLEGDKDQLKRFAQLPTRLAELESDQQSSLINWGYVAADSVIRENRSLKTLLADGRAKPFRLPFNIPYVAE